MSAARCVDCLHFRPPRVAGFAVAGYARCNRFRMEPNPHPVTGEPGDEQYCEQARAMSRSCGPDAVGFQPRNGGTTLADEKHADRVTDFRSDVNDMLRAQGKIE